MKQGFVNICGKEYKTVALRVQEFREDFPDHTLRTEIIKLDEDQCLIKAAIFQIFFVNDEPRLVEVATGHAHEWRKSSQINGTSYVENCETSAIGRALSALGIGGQEFASAEEVANAIHQQNASKTNAETPKTAEVRPMKHTPTQGAFDALEAADKEKAQSRHAAILDAAAIGDWDAVLEVYDESEGDLKVAVWELLGSQSAIRNRIKKLCDERKAA